MLGPEVWVDKEPQSHHSLHPWLLAHMRESTYNVELLLKTVVDPQIEDLRSFCLSTKEETLDMWTEYWKIEETGKTLTYPELNIKWKELKLVLVTKEQSPEFL